jgi:hypothetical protein
VGKKGNNQSRNGDGKRRYTLVIPDELFKEVESVANSREVPVIDILRRFIAMGLYIENQAGKGADFVIRQDDTEERLVFF